MPSTSALAARFHALDQRLRPAFIRRLQRFFAGQAERVLTRYLALYGAADTIAPQPAPEELLPDEERTHLWLALLPFLLTTTTQSGTLAGNLVGLAELTETDPMVSELLNEAGTRLAGMHRTTLDAVRTTLADGAARGYTVSQIAQGVPDDGFRGLRAVVTETYRGRAETIARTELAQASARVAIDRYQQAGHPMVYVVDGTTPTACGWLYHDDDDKANDTWRTVIDARAHPVSHPNCVRRFLPGPPRTVPPATPPQRLRITVAVTRGPR